MPLSSVNRLQRYWNKKDLTFCLVLPKSFRFVLFSWKRITVFTLRVLRRLLPRRILVVKSGCIISIFIAKMYSRQIILSKKVCACHNSLDKMVRKCLALSLFAGAPHAHDLCYLFLWIVPVNPKFPVCPRSYEGEYRKIADLLGEMWTNFAING